uniref:Uncharacterized protein n=1 Tax=Megaselia scalaris TaxID=36166 RepID=T1GXU0_MEGSC
LKLNKRAVIDCDFVINKIDEKNLRAWLYRAAAYFKQDDMKNFENCVKLVKKNNPKELEYIEEFVEKIRKEQF